MNARFYDPSTGRFISQDTYSGNPYDPWTQNLYTYCGNNPTNMVDPTGHTPWWSNVLNFAQQAFQYASNLAMADGPAYVADIVSLVPIAVGAVALVVAGAGYLVDEISTAVSKAQSANTVIGGSTTAPWNPPADNSKEDSNTKSYSESRAKEDSKAAEKEIAKNQDKPIYIYRHRGTNPGNLVPTKRDVELNSGLSFSTVYQPNSLRTTIQQVNATGVLMAVQDGPTHVSIYPIGGSIADWKKEGSSSIWTQTLYGISTKMRR